MEWPREENCIKTGGGRAYIVYITSRRRTVGLGLLQGVYERFPIRNFIRYTVLLYRGEIFKLFMGLKS